MDQQTDKIHPAAPTAAPTSAPTTAAPTTASPTTAAPTTTASPTASPTTTTVTLQKPLAKELRKYEFIMVRTPGRETQNPSRVFHATASQCACEKWPAHRPRAAARCGTKRRSA